MFPETPGLIQQRIYEELLFKSDLPSMYNCDFARSEKVEITSTNQAYGKQFLALLIYLQIRKLKMTT